MCLDRAQHPRLELLTPRSSVRFLPGLASLRPFWLADLVSPNLGCLNVKRMASHETTRRLIYDIQASANVPVGGAPHPTLLKSPRIWLVNSASLGHRSSASCATEVKLSTILGKDYYISIEQFLFECNNLSAAY